MQNNVFKKIQKEFVEWVVGTEEEDPFPYEIQYFFFFLEKKDGVNSLYFGGGEFDDYKNLPYFPLEAQAFFCKDFNFCKEKIIDEKFIAMLIDLSFGNNDFYKIFENKIIHICYSINGIFSKFKVK